MKKRKLNIKALVLVILILVLIDSVVLIMTEGFGKNLVVNIIFYILEILVTIWIVKDNGNFKNKK